MLTKKEIKDIQSLHLKKARNLQGRFVAEGPKLVAELVHHRLPFVQQVYATAPWAEKHGHLKKLLMPVTDAELQQLSFSKTPNQVVAVMQQWQTPAPEPHAGWCIYLDAVQDPGNLGTIIRIADWFGIAHVVCTDGCADCFNPKVVQATMGSLARVSVYYDKDLSWIKKQTLPLFAAALEGSTSFSKAHAGILLIGNEGAGLRPEIAQLATQNVTIKKRGGAESLNAAVAAGILLSHLVS